MHAPALDKQLQELPVIQSRAVMGGDTLGFEVVASRVEQVLSCAGRQQSAKEPFQESFMHSTIAAARPPGSRFRRRCAFGSKAWTQSQSRDIAVRSRPGR